MPRTAAAAALLAALAAGGLTGFAPSAAAAPAQQPPADVAACYDGTCTLQVTGPVEIPLDGRAGFTSLSVTGVKPYGVTFVVQQATSGTGIGVVGPGGTSRFGSGTGTIAVHVLEVSGTTARLDVTSTVP